MADSAPAWSLIARRPAPPEPSSSDRIRDAALKSFAAKGFAATSLRTVAKAAGSSVGLVQHYFGTKAALIAAVDDYVVRVISEAVGAAPLPQSADDALTAMGDRLTTVVAEEPDVFDYLGRALVEGDSVGSEIFDSLVRLSTAQSTLFAEREQSRADLDPLWGALNPLILRLGVMILRGHIERHLPESFTTPAQLKRWDAAVTALIRHGQLKT